MPSKFDTTPLSETVGAEITGLDISEPLSPEIVADAQAAFERHHMLLFRGFDLSSEQQARFARYFGGTSQRELNKQTVENDDNQYVSNTRPDGIFGKGELDFHIDQLFLEEPLKALILFAVEIPEHGGGGEVFEHTGGL